MFPERAVEGVDISLAVAEDERVLHVLALDDAAQRLPLVARPDHGEALDHRLRRARRRRDVNFLRVHQERIGEAADFLRHGRREEQGLADFRQLPDDFLDIGDEPHVEHPVGLVDHQDLDVAQQDAAALEMIDQAARRRDQHVDTAAELLRLVVHRDAADQKRLAELVELAVFVEVLRDLHREFARRRQDQRARHARPGPPGRQDLDHRQDEGGGLARPRLGAAQDVAPGQRGGDRLLLDRCRRCIADIRNRPKDVGAEPQFIETH